MDLLLEAATLRQERKECSGSSSTISEEEMSDECSSQVEQGEGDQQSDSSVCSCGDKRHDAEQNSDDLKKQSSDQHNENERKRRKSMKYAVHTLRQQLTKKPRKSAVNTVLQAAYEEIQDLKSDEREKEDVLEELKKNHTVLKYLLEKTTNELKQQSPKGTCLSATSHLGKPAGAIVPTQQSGSGVYQPPPVGSYWPAGMPFTTPLPPTVTIPTSQTYISPTTVHIPPSIAPSFPQLPFPHIPSPSLFPYLSSPITIPPPRPSSFLPGIPFLSGTPLTISPVYYPSPILLSANNGHPLANTNSYLTTSNAMVPGIRSFENDSSINDNKLIKRRSSSEKQLLKGRKKTHPEYASETKRGSYNEDDYKEHTITVVRGYNSSYHESVITDKRSVNSTQSIIDLPENYDL